MRKRLEQREQENPMSNVRIEPTLGPANEPTTEPGKIRIITAEEYTRAAQAVWKSDKSSDNVPSQNDQVYQRRPRQKSTWKRLFGTTMWIAFFCANVVLIYFELQPQTLKPTFSIVTPWGVAEILTPWGTESDKIAQFDVRKIRAIEKIKKLKAQPDTMKNSEPSVIPNTLY